jgi:hypothetical protein
MEENGGSLQAAADAGEDEAEIAILKDFLILVRLDLFGDGGEFERLGDRVRLGRGNGHVDGLFEGLDGLVLTVRRLGLGLRGGLDRGLAALRHEPGQPDHNQNSHCYDGKQLVARHILVAIIIPHIAILRRRVSRPKRTEDEGHGSGNGVVASLRERLASSKPPHGEGRATERAVALNRLNCVLGAGGEETAIAAKERRQQPLVQSDQADEQLTH